MNETEVLDVGREAIWVMIKAAGPLMLRFAPASVVSRAPRLACSSAMAWRWISAARFSGVLPHFGHRSSGSLGVPQTGQTVVTATGTSEGR